MTFSQLSMWLSVSGCILFFAILLFARKNEKIANELRESKIIKPVVYNSNRLVNLIIIGWLIYDWDYIKYQLNYPLAISIAVLVLGIFSYSFYHKLKDRLEKAKEKFFLVKAKYGIYPHDGNDDIRLCFSNPCRYEGYTQTHLKDNTGEVEFLATEKECSEPYERKFFYIVNEEGDYDFNHPLRRQIFCSCLHVDLSMLISATPMKYSVIKNKLVPL